MERGHLRFEAGVSVRPKGQQELGPRKAEIKNLNSFAAVRRSVEYEIQRQIELMEKGEPIPSTTRLWDEVRGVTVAMRSKEEAQDYRYFPEPDLVPLHIEDERLARLRAALPELPEQRRQRLIRDYSLPAYDAGVLTATREMADYYEECVRLGGDPKKVSNWIMGDFSRLLNAAQIGIRESKVLPQSLTDLLKLIDDGTITGRVAKDVFEKMFATGNPPQQIIVAEGLSGAVEGLEAIVAQVLAQNPDAVANYRKGKTNAIRFLIGQVMKATRGQAKPPEVEALLEAKLVSGE
jgi:aspartyl-tRNA(Asn)/glutamyl-tRNA(Gln) amidotransferase subunit B